MDQSLADAVSKLELLKKRPQKSDIWGIHAYQLGKIVEILATELVFLKSSIGDVEDTGSFSMYLGGKKERIELREGVKPYDSLMLKCRDRKSVV